MNWKTETIHVDQSTGEILKRYQILNGEFIVITKTKKTERYENGGKTTYYKYCQRDGQTRIDFGTVHENRNGKHTIHHSH